MISFLAATAIATAAPPPSAGEAGLITMADYPPDALRQHAQGLVRVALHVDETGHVASCTVETSSGFPSLDEATCRVLSTRARFIPARDQAGRPTTDVLRTAIKWRIPD